MSLLSRNHPLAFCRNPWPWWRLAWGACWNNPFNGLLQRAIKIWVILKPKPLKTSRPCCGAATQRGAQAQAAATPPLCPGCHQELTRLTDGHARTFGPRFGAITLQRTRGCCQRWGKWPTPAATALGLEATAGDSPAGQAMAALLASKRPVEDARLGLDALGGQLHAEALRRGLGQAASAWVIGDGAVWIWRLADDRFAQAHQRLDFYHAVEHWGAVGRTLFGDDQGQFTAWLQP